jgi:hypothetical protein
MIAFLPVFMCLGFMIAVLYIDLSFDLLSLPHRKSGAEIPVGSLGPVVGYYGRITQNPYLLMFVMMTNTICIIWEIVYDLVPRAISYPSLLLMGAAMILGSARVIPAATKLSKAGLTAEEKTRLAHSLFPAHIILLILVLSLTVLQFRGVIR